MVSAKHSDYTNVSSLYSTTQLPERTGINDHPIKMIFHIIYWYSNIIHL